MFARNSFRFSISILSRSLTLLAPVAIMFAALSAKALPIDLYVSTEYGIDQSTGMKGPVLLNPSGKAELVFFERGIELHFQDSNSAKRHIRIHLDFDGLLEAPEQARRITTQIYDNIQLNGPRVMAGLLGQVSQNAMAQNQKFVVMLDKHKNPGFLKVDYDLGSVRLVTSSGENVRFQNMVAQVFLPQQENAADKSEAKPDDKRVPEAEGLKKPLANGNPTFVDGSAKAELGPQPLVSCELRFTPTW